MRYRIERLDRVAFSAPVREHHLELRIAPWDDATQGLTSLTVTTEPATALASHRDGFGNQVHRTALLSPHQTLSVQMRAEVETLVENPFALDPVDPAREGAWLADALRQAPRLWDFVLHRSVLTPDLTAAGGPAAALAIPPRADGRALIADLQQAMAWIAGGFDYQPLDGAPSATLDTLLTERTGGAADLAHLLISIVRGWGVPARLVAGYLDAAYFDPDDEEPDAEPRPQTLHHWAEVLIPGGGWRGCDPAHGLLADATYIRLAVGRDARDLPAWRQGFKGEGRLTEQTCEISVVRLT